jgi:hypothetical protein
MTKQAPITPANVRIGLAIDDLNRIANRLSVVRAALQAESNANATELARLETALDSTAYLLEYGY